MSLREPTKPVLPPEAAEGGVEITWKVFSGDLSEAIGSILLMRLHRDGENLGDDVAGSLRAHVTRGLGYLASGTDTKSIADFVGRWGS